MAVIILIISNFILDQLLKQRARVKPRIYYGIIIGSPANYFKDLEGLKLVLDLDTTVRIMQSTLGSTVVINEMFRPELDITFGGH